MLGLSLEQKMAKGVNSGMHVTNAQILPNNQGEKKSLGKKKFSS